MGGVGRLKEYVDFMREHGVAELEADGIRLVLGAKPVLEPVSHDELPQAPALEETEEERLVRLQREHTERENLLFYSS